MPVGDRPASRAPAGVDAPDAATDDRRVVEHVGDVRVDVARAEADDRLRVRRRRRTRGPRSPSRSTGRASPGSRSRTARTGDSERGSAARPPWARCGRRRRAPPAASPRVALGQDVAEQVLGLVDPAQDGVAPGEDLHRHDRVEALGLEDLVGPREVHVGRVAGQDLAGGTAALQTHRSVGLLVAGRLWRHRARAPDDRAASVAQASAAVQSALDGRVGLAVERVGHLARRRRRRRRRPRTTMVSSADDDRSAEQAEADRPTLAGRLGAVPASAADDGCRHRAREVAAGQRVARRASGRPPGSGPTGRGSANGLVPAGRSAAASA